MTSTSSVAATLTLDDCDRGRMIYKHLLFKYITLIVENILCL